MRGGAVWESALKDGAKRRMRSVGSIVTCLHRHLLASSLACIFTYLHLHLLRVRVGAGREEVEIRSRSTGSPAYSSKTPHH